MSVSCAYRLCLLSHGSIHDQHMLCQCLCFVLKSLEIQENQHANVHETGTFYVRSFIRLSND